MNRMRWVEALECLPEGPERDLLRAVGEALTKPTDVRLVSLGARTDALVDHILARHPLVGSDAS